MPLSDAPEVISTLVGVPPPVLPIVLRGGTRLSGLYVCRPFDGDLVPMDVHILSLAHRGTGRMRARVEGRQGLSYPVAGAVTVIPRGLGGHWHFDGHALVSNVYLGSERFRQCADHAAEGRSFEIRYGNDVADERMAHILRLICSEVQQPSHHSLLFLEHGVELACLHLLRAHSSLARLAAPPAKGLPASQVGRVVDYMQAHLDGDISLQELADLVGLSRFHFCSAFKAATGMPPYAKLTQLRMQAAAQLLLHTRHAILDVALAVGYRTQSAFSAVFGRTMGMPPSRFRSEGRR
ncbi:MULTISPECIES: helix-turn-helix transcriptional regulator [Gammaproteobacteria]|uniref:helix-turn-helix transcriptional regulator n=1 Tax=Gammaproteobacteria TaxID=1236 RepID=UPI0015B15D69|nr:AraC family transcriptional regulator [Pseudomonas sp. Hp2]